MSEEIEPSRRKFLTACAGAMGAMAAGVAAAPFVAYLTPTVDLESEGSLEVDASSLLEGEAVAKRFQRSTIFILKTKGAIKVLSAGCTHAGCLVLWDHRRERFFCPCHGAEFSDTGEAVKGPATKPLAKIPFTIDESGQKIVIGESEETA